MMRQNVYDALSIVQAAAFSPDVNIDDLREFVVDMIKLVEKSEEIIEAQERIIKLDDANINMLVGALERYGDIIAQIQKQLEPNV